MSKGKKGILLVLAVLLFLLSGEMRKEAYLAKRETRIAAEQQRAALRRQMEANKAYEQEKCAGTFLETHRYLEEISAAASRVASWWDGLSERAGERCRELCDLFPPLEYVHLRGRS